MAITLSLVAVAFWLLSYSWLLGLVLPADVSTKTLPEETLTRLGVSPWLVAELVAIPTGLGGAVLGLLALRRAWTAAGDGSERRLSWGS